MDSDGEDGARIPGSQGSKFATMEEPEDAVDFFRQKKSMAQIMAEKIRRENSKKQKSERRRSSQTASVERADAAVQDSKRRRVSREDDEDGLAPEPDSVASHRSPSPATTPPRDRNARAKSAQTKQAYESPTTLSGKYTQLTGSKSKSRTPQPTEPFTLSDSDDDPFMNRLRNDNIIDDERPDDDDLSSQMANGKPQKNPIDVDKDSESDDEFAYLRAAAREKAAQQSKLAASAADGNQSHQDINARVRERLEQFRKTGSLAKAASESSSTPERVGAVASNPTPAVDPKVEILVTSTIEGTKPLMFIRKLSQRIKEVRISWCDRQEIGLTESQKDNIFLTWKGTKLFDSTTCQRMPGLRVNGGRVDTYGEGFDDGKLHMEAWTPETFQEFQRSKALGRTIFTQDEEETDEEHELASELETAESKLKLVLKSRGIEDFKLVVKGQTRIAKIISSFQSQRNIGEDKEITLRFDGDVLDPESCVQDCDFEDYDVIEVQVK